MSKKVLSVGGLAAALSLQNTGLLRPVREEAKNPDLKPCPYCGGKAELREGEECAYVQCLDASYHRGRFGEAPQYRPISKEEEK